MSPSQSGSFFIPPGTSTPTSSPTSSSSIPSTSKAVPIFPNPATGGFSEGTGFTSWLMPTTETTLRLLKQYLETYRQYVANNPVWVSEIESALYWVSYLLSTTRFHNSRVISELLYSCSSILTLFNDTLLRKAYTINQNTNTYVDRLQTILSFIEYIQVFLELTALQVYGKYGKWIIISIVEIVKALIRLFLLFKFQQGLTRRQYLIPLNRAQEYELYKMRQAKKQEKSSGTRPGNNNEFYDTVEELPNAEDVPETESGGPMQDEKLVQQFELEQNAFQLPSTGRMIRNIESAPPKSGRMWITPTQTVRLRRLLRKHNRTAPSITPLNRKRIIGELIHILRPIAHLTAGALAGGLDSWSPYLLSFSLDIASLRLLKGSNFLFGRDNLLNLIARPRAAQDDPTDPVDEVWNWAEQIEIQRRYMSLFMYLLRSPFYDRFTQERLLRLLSILANNIPIFGRLLRPFIAYLPEWQRVYFYMWNQ